VEVAGDGEVVVFESAHGGWGYVLCKQFAASFCSWRTQQGGEHFKVSDLKGREQKSRSMSRSQLRRRKKEGL
jgi:hypothetical protein